MFLGVDFGVALDGPGDWACAEPFLVDEEDTVSISWCFLVDVTGGGGFLRAAEAELLPSDNVMYGIYQF